MNTQKNDSGKEEFPGKDLSEFIPSENGVFTKLPLQQRNLLLGEILSLCFASKLHGGYSINGFARSFLPPVHLNQFRIYRVEGGGPVGFITWAKLTKETEKAYVAGEKYLLPEDWNAGDQYWIIDFICPFGHAKKVLNDMKKNIFPDDIGKYVRIDRNGNAQGIRRVHGVNRVGSLEPLDGKLKLSESLTQNWFRPSANSP